jgi:hypothetical protein
MTNLVPSLACTAEGCELFLSPHLIRQAILREARKCLRIRMARRSTPVTKATRELPAVNAGTKEHLGIANSLDADLHQQVEGNTMGQDQVRGLQHALQS